jgi:DNA-binding response OmpR family regulator
VFESTAILCYNSSRDVPFREFFKQHPTNLSGHVWSWTPGRGCLRPAAASKPVSRVSQFSPQSYRVLVIDDNLGLLGAVASALELEGYQAYPADSGETALNLVKRIGLPHLALVDINMPPGMDGFEFCEQVHEFSDLPIIMLTAIADEATIVQAIEHHAEDYITKPFSLDELLVRVRRVLRGLGDFACTLDPAQSVDPHLSINFPECQVTVDGQAIPLTPTETKLLYILMRSAGKTVSSSFIQRRLWPGATADEGRLRVYVHRLRQKIEVSQPQHRYILAQRSVGYAFVPCDLP